ncbi:MAG: hypothetical protein JKY11_06030 [Alphaproteobacteria bacterium]|nr:hypothetical protein [Alphaproteobacteria bacterium]
MVDLFNPPTREQLARIAQGDNRLLKAFEDLFKAVGQTGVTDQETLTLAIEGLQQAPNSSGAILATLAGKQDIISSINSGQFVFVSDRNDFPTAVSGVVNLVDNVTYFVTTNVDLEGDRIVSGQNSTLMGGSTENCSLTSTGLGSGTPFITSLYSLPLHRVAIKDVGTALDLDGSVGGLGLDWTSVNFVNCDVVGTIKDYDNFIGRTIGFIGSANLTFDGGFDTIAFDATLFSGIAGETTVIIPSTATISRRFRIIYSAFISLTGSTSIDVDVTATIPVEGYILDTCNFAGPGASIAGVAHDDNKALFTNNVGVSNSARLSNYYMIGNATATVITTINTPVKALGTTTSDPITQKFTNTNNRATSTGAIAKTYRATAYAALTSTTNVQMAIYIAVNDTVILQSVGFAIAGTGGNAESVASAALSNIEETDYIEVWVENQTGTQNITVENLNVIIEAIAS